MMALPLALWVGMTRYNLFDVDRFISVSASYSIAAAVLVIGLVVVAPPATQSLVDFADIPQTPRKARRTVMKDWQSQAHVKWGRYPIPRSDKLTVQTPILNRFGDVG